MAYDKQTWTDGSTPVDASHMSHIEDGIAALDNDKAAKSDLDALSTKVDEEQKVRAEKDDEQDEKIQANTDLIDSLGGRYIVCDDAASSSIVAEIQDNWSAFPTGVSFIEIVRNQTSGAIVSKQNSSNGCAIVFGHASAIYPPHILRCNAGTWTDVTISTT